jgi:RNA polymerase sigma-70 factor, ECF subfamily
MDHASDTASDGMDASPAPIGGAASAGANDATLLRRMSEGDERALGALYDRWSSAVHSLVLHIVRDRDEAEDVVEETFWQAWRQAARYEPARGTVATWLLTIARSRALDRLRAVRRSREDAEPVPPELDVATGPTADPAGYTEAAERRARVVAALEALPREQREALELAYFGGLSQTEIAAQTGQPLGTVKTRMRLALQKLRVQLASLREETP